MYAILVPSIVLRTRLWHTIACDCVRSRKILNWIFVSLITLGHTFTLPFTWSTANIPLLNSCGTCRGASSIWYFNIFRDLLHIALAVACILQLYSVRFTSLRAPHITQWTTHSFLLCTWGLCWQLYAAHLILFQCNCAVHHETLGERNCYTSNHLTL